MLEPHEGALQIKHKFQETFKWLEKSVPSVLMTKRGTDFIAKAEITQKGPHTGEKVIRFMQDNKEYGRAYECCWSVTIIVTEPVLVCIVLLLMRLLCEIKLSFGVLN
ncbi:MAG TPA: hypothetical protein DCY53_08135 [Desulfobacteraceae bacterium]|nr:hypothetical protein [Desulfobacteraceae bacterium]